MSALQPRVNRAISDRLLADTAESPTLSGTSLEVLMTALGAILEPSGVPLWWVEAHAGKQRPYLIYGPQARESDIEGGRCGTGQVGRIVYEIRLVLEGIVPSKGIAVVDRIGELLAGYSVEVEGVEVSFDFLGDVAYPDPLAGESGITHVGTLWACRIKQ